MRLERRVDGGGGTIGWMLEDGGGARVWCGELERSEFLALPLAQQIGLRDDLGWYLVAITAEGQAPRRRVLARVCDESTGLALARAVLSGGDLAGITGRRPIDAGGLQG